MTCPTCQGHRVVPHDLLVFAEQSYAPCPNCTDGTWADVPPIGARVVDEVEGDLRLTLWNAGMSLGMGQGRVLDLIKRAMDSALMHRVLGRLRRGGNP